MIAERDEVSVWLAVELRKGAAQTLSDAMAEVQGILAQNGIEATIRELRAVHAKVAARRDTDPEFEKVATSMIRKFERRDLRDR